MARPASTRKCPTCGEPGLKRNGTRGGKTRWRCTKCGSSTLRRREHAGELATFQRFLAWVKDQRPQRDFDATTTGRTLRRHSAWCWNIPIPPPPCTGQVHDQIFIDGTYLAYGWCLLIARASTGPVVAWQWCHTENSTAYGKLLSAIPAPRVITTDGNGGALKAIAHHCPQSKIQRCLLHVHRNNTRDLTRHPHTTAGKTLLALSQQLLTITTTTQAARWAALLAAFHTQYATYLKERTYAAQDPVQAASRGKKSTGWWYTHERDRRVYQRLKRLYQAGQLFTYLTAAPEPLERTTNPVESINHRIKNVITHHPGLSPDHMTCAIEWVLHAYTENPHSAQQILQNWRQAGKPPRMLIPAKHATTTRPGPKQYDTALSAEEGLYTRKGWAGRPL